MRCEKCGSEKVKHVVLHPFGDPNLGVQDEWFECENCGAEVPALNLVPIAARYFDNPCEALVAAREKLDDEEMDDH